MVPSGTNLGFFKISNWFSTFWLGDSKCTETELKKFQIVTFEANLTILGWQSWHPCWSPVCPPPRAIDSAPFSPRRLSLVATHSTPQDTSHRGRGLNYPPNLRIDVYNWMILANRTSDDCLRRSVLHVTSDIRQVSIISVLTSRVNLLFKRSCVFSRIYFLQDQAR